MIERRQLFVCVDYQMVEKCAEPTAYTILNSSSDDLLPFISNRKKKNENGAANEK